MPPSRASAGAAGFSLIDALVALVIAGLALAAIAGVLADGLTGHEASAEAATALTLAEGKIAAAGASEPLHPGRSRGVFADRFRWEVTIAPYDDPPDKPAASALAPPPVALRLYRIAAAVTWREGLRRRQVALATLRLGP